MSVSPKTDTGAAILAGLAATVILVGVVGAWAATTAISGAVVAGGQIVVHGKPRAIQSQEGGTVRAIAVTDGARVEAGALLVAFDDTVARANLDIAMGRLSDALALVARLEAEAAGTMPDFAPPPLPFPAPDLTRAAIDQSRILETRVETRDGLRDGLVQTVEQLARSAVGIAAQIDALDAQTAQMDDDLSRQAALDAKGLGRHAQTSTLRRERASADGRRASLVAETARLEAEIRAKRIEVRQSERAMDETVAEDLREGRARVDELILEIVTLRQSLSRAELRAPVAGTVHDLQVNIEGGVVSAGETVLSLVPMDQGVEVEIRIEPDQIDAVRPGQIARVEIVALGPEARVEGAVTTVSADVLSDPRTGALYYRAAVALGPEARAALGGAALLPGMPVQAFLETSRRTVLSYLLAPLSDHLRRAFREV